MAIFVVLLRAIGPATHKIMSMSQWRDAVIAQGLEAPETYLSTGNMIVEGPGSIEAITRTMNEIVLTLGLGFGNRAIVAMPSDLTALVQANPLPEAASTRPSQMGVYFFAAWNPDFTWIAEYKGKEDIRVVGKSLVVDYRGGIARSKLPRLIESKSGTATARNWNTLMALAQRADARPDHLGNTHLG